MVIAMTAAEVQNHTGATTWRQESQLLVLRLV